MNLIAINHLKNQQKTWKKSPKKTNNITIKSNDIILVNWNEFNCYKSLKKSTKNMKKVTKKKTNNITIKSNDIITVNWNELKLM